MPVTPFHIIAGVAAKSIRPKYFSWTVFALANVLIDTEAVYYSQLLTLKASRSDILSAEAETLAADAAALHTVVRAAPSIAGALQAIAGGSGDADRPVMICGSLYLAGHVLAANGTLPD